MTSATKSGSALQLLWKSRSRLARIALLLVILELILLCLGRVTTLRSSSLEAWARLVGFFLVLILLGIAVRWFRRIVMWRLRNRLIVTYVFVAVIPVVLLFTIGVVTAYLFAGQFASFVVTSDIHSDLKAMAAANRVRIRDVVEQFRLSGSLEKAAVTLNATESPELRMTLWLQPANGKPRAVSVPADTPIITMPPPSIASQERAVVSEPDGLRLYTWASAPVGNARLTLISYLPLGFHQLRQIAADIGEITLYAPDLSGHGIPMTGDAKDDITISIGPPQAKAQRNGKSPSTSSESGGIRIRDGNRVYIRTPQSSSPVAALTPITAGSLHPSRSLDPEVVFGLPFNVIDWNTGQTATALLRVRTLPSLLYRRLFVALGEFAGLVFYVLAAVGIVFALIELFALITGISLTRTMTRSVANLYRATQHINRGDFDHRIQVRTSDQLAALETSFNSMSESLGRLMLEQKAKQRMESELAIAQEVQAQLFPRQAFQLHTLEMHGTCRPARTVSGDYYDFLDLGSERLGIALGDISGKGISAALMMATVHAAVRAYGWGRLAQHQPLVVGASADSASGGGQESLVGAAESPAAILGLLNSHLFHSSPAEKYATLFLASWNGQTHRLQYSNGGHLSPIVIGHDGAVTYLDKGGMVIGLFDQMQWEAGEVELHPGDLLIAYTDGITEPENEFGEFGDQRLLSLIQDNRNLPLDRLSEAVIAAVEDWIGANEQPDDMTLVLARAR